MKELSDIALQNKTVAVRPTYGVRKHAEPSHGAMSTLIFSAGIRIENECRLKNRIERFEHGVVDDAVAND
ncbi:MAG: hypothetical protein AAB967_00295 [Patescibacteria group bacterium]